MSVLKREYGLSLEKKTRAERGLDLRKPGRRGGAESPLTAGEETGKRGELGGGVRCSSRRARGED